MEVAIKLNKMPRYLYLRIVDASNECGDRDKVEKLMSCLHVRMRKRNLCLRKVCWKFEKEVMDITCLSQSPTAMHLHY